MYKKFPYGKIFIPERKISRSICLQKKLTWKFCVQRLRQRRSEIQPAWFAPNRRPREPIQTTKSHSFDTTKECTFTSISSKIRDFRVFWDILPKSRILPKWAIPVKSRKPKVAKPWKRRPRPDLRIGLWPILPKIAKMAKNHRICQNWPKWPKIAKTWWSSGWNRQKPGFGETPDRPKSGFGPIFNQNFTYFYTRFHPPFGAEFSAWGFGPEKGGLTGVVWSRPENPLKIWVKNMAIFFGRFLIYVKPRCGAEILETT